MAAEFAVSSKVMLIANGDNNLPCFARTERGLVFSEAFLVAERQKLVDTVHYFWNFEGLFQDEFQIQRTTINFQSFGQHLDKINHIITY